MADRVDAAVQGMQPVGPQPNFDCLPANSERKQLAPRHHPMLSLGQFSEARVQSTRLPQPVHNTGKCRCVLSSPPFRGQALWTRGAFDGGFGGGRLGLAGGGAFQGVGQGSHVGAGRGLEDVGGDALAGRQAAGGA